MLSATEKGLQQFAWWPDWRDQCAAIICSGPSLKQMDISCLAGRIHVIAIKQTYDRAQFADVVYGCDAPWWLHRKGLPEFKGLKITHGNNAIQHYGELKKLDIELTDQILIDEPMKVGNGGNSAFQALNMAIQFGARDIILVACDLNDRKGKHWYGRNTWNGANNPDKFNFDRWLRGFRAIKQSIDRLGIDVVNASPDSDLDTFRKQPLADILQEWGL